TSVFAVPRSMAMSVDSMPRRLPIMSYPSSFLSARTVLPGAHVQFFTQPHTSSAVNAALMQESLGR
ncbi:MAG: hypothetical protein CME91_06090, partial [Hyphomonadaceae bacterium]|nr:hypothetical protein [Hyphomonadaceae bacterium]